VLTVGDLTAVLDELYPPRLAEGWDAVGLVCGDPSNVVRRVYFCVDVVEATVDEALGFGAELLVVHHPLLLRGVTSVATNTYKGRLIHRLIRAGAALFTAHTNADAAAPGVSDALAARLGLQDLRPLHPSGDGAEGIGRVGTLPGFTTLAEFAAQAAEALPGTAGGLKVAGDPNRHVRTVAVSGGAGDGYLGDAAKAGADVYLTADLRHHPASEYSENDGPALIDAAHWATERPWLDDASAALTAALRPATVETFISDLVTDPWTSSVMPAVPSTA
jgi:dinuclear metal center YbgI/SA1388 family protein